MEPAKEDPSGVIVDGVPAVGLANDFSWLWRCFSRDEKPLTKREGV